MRGATNQAVPGTRYILKVVMLGPPASADRGYARAQGVNLCALGTLGYAEPRLSRRTVEVASVSKEYRAMRSPE